MCVVHIRTYATSRCDALQSQFLWWSDPDGLVEDGSMEKCSYDVNDEAAPSHDGADDEQKEEAHC